MSPRARRRHWWAIADSIERGTKKYHTLNVRGKRQRAVTVVSTRSGDTISCACLSCVRSDCAHAVFVHEQLVPSPPAIDAPQTRVLFAEPQPWERLFPLPGPHSGKPLGIVPRDELLRCHAYYSNPRRAWRGRSREIVAHVDATIEHLDTARLNKFDQFPDALRDDPTDLMPWEKSQ